MINDLKPEIEDISFKFSYAIIISTNLNTKDLDLCAIVVLSEALVMEQTKSCLNLKRHFNNNYGHIWVWL